MTASLSELKQMADDNILLLEQADRELASDVDYYQEETRVVSLMILAMLETLYHAADLLRVAHDEVADEWLRVQIEELLA